MEAKARYDKVGLRAERMKEGPRDRRSTLVELEQRFRALRAAGPAPRITFKFKFTAKAENT